MNTPDQAAQDFADSFKTAANFPVHTTIYGDTAHGMPIMVRRSTFCFCAYVGVPLSHVLSGIEDLELDCHWGTTFSERGQDNTPFEAGYHWFGWDYGHAGDALINESGQDIYQSMTDNMPAQLQEELKALNVFNWSEKKHWTLGEVMRQAQDVRSQLLAQTHRAQLQAIAAINGAKAAPVVLPSTTAPLFNRKFKAMSRRRQKIALRKRLLAIGTL